MRIESQKDDRRKRTFVVGGELALPDGVDAARGFAGRKQALDVHLLKEKITTCNLFAFPGVY